MFVPSFKNSQALGQQAYFTLLQRPIHIHGQHLNQYQCHSYNKQKCRGVVNTREACDLVNQPGKGAKQNTGTGHRQPPYGKPDMQTVASHQKQDYSSY